MHGNGSDRYAHLAERIAELEAAHAVLTRIIEETWRPRLLAVEQDIDRIAAELATLLQK